MSTFPKRNRKWFTVACFLLTLASACTTVPDHSTKLGDVTYSESVKEFSGRIEMSFRKNVAFLESREIETYLSKIANRVVGPGPVAISVEVVSGAKAGLDPSLWAVPNGRIFFDVRALRSMKFENEIAAALTLAWSRSEGPEYRNRLVVEAGRGEPDLAALFKFGEVEDNRAIEASVDRLYKAGYDPRGLVNYFDRVATKSKNREGDPLVDSDRDKARRTISYYAPLLNPTVRTEDFYRMRKRLERL